MVNAGNIHSVKQTPANGRRTPAGAGDAGIELAVGEPALPASAIVRESVIRCWTGVCPLCGGALAHIASSTPGDQRAISIVQCVACNRSFTVTITVAAAPELSRARKPHPEGCGCPPCRNARATHCSEGHELPADRVCRECHPHAGEGSNWRRSA